MCGCSLLCQSLLPSSFRASRPLPVSGSVRGAWSPVAATADCGFSRLPSQGETPLTLNNKGFRSSRCEAWLSMLMRSSASLPHLRNLTSWWDVTLVLRFLTGAPCGPLRQASLRDVTLKIFFLPALASAKRFDELHGFS